MIAVLASASVPRLAAKSGVYPATISIVRASIDCAAIMLDADIVRTDGACTDSLVAVARTMRLRGVAKKSGGDLFGCCDSVAPTLEYGSASAMYAPDLLVVSSSTG